MLFLFFLISLTLCDLPVDCRWPDFQGKWVFTLTDSKYSNEVVKECDKFEDIPEKYPVIETKTISISDDNVARDEDSRVEGTWTTVYNQGIEITIAKRRYFAFFRYEKEEENTKSLCNQIWTGWFHNISQPKGDYPVGWGCFAGAVKDGKKVERIIENKERVYKIPSQEDIDRINSQNGGQWEAVKYPDEFYEELFERMKYNTIPRPPKKRTPPKAYVTDVPDEYDWRNVSGVNFVSPVRNQGGCGSCYSFGATGMYEARARIMTKNEWTPIFSPQEIVDCDLYSQGCEGGFPYLVGRHGEHFGIVEESCDPYVGYDQSCPSQCTEKSDRTFLYGTNYLGGSYGRCSEDLMLEEIYNNGPVAVSFYVYGDFFSYRSGIYEHKGSENFFEETNHCVLAVGWGVENGKKFWIVKNSWGTSWGMKGYFWIVRGTDNCAIESMAVHSEVVKQ